MYSFKKVIILNSLLKQKDTILLIHFYFLENRTVEFLLIFKPLFPRKELANSCLVVDYSPLNSDMSSCLNSVHVQSAICH